MTQETEAVYRQTMEWWDKLDVSWKSIFFYNFLKERAPESLSNLVWECKELVGVEANGTVVGLVDSGRLSQLLSHPEYFVALQALHTKEVSDFSTDVSWRYNWKGNQYHIEWMFNPETSAGIDGLRDVETVFMYKQSNDESKQPRIDISHFRGLSKLSKLHLHITHCDILQELLMLNLPKLSKINLYTGINQQSYYYSAKEEEYIDFIKSTTHVKFEVLSYQD